MKYKPTPEDLEKTLKFHNYKIPVVARVYEVSYQTITNWIKKIEENKQRDK